MKIVYPAIFYYSDEAVPYGVYFPDFDGYTQGETLTEALDMASEYLGIYMADLVENGIALPKPTNINTLSLEANNPDKDTEYDKEKSFISAVMVDVSEYVESKELIKKTLTIPKWVNDLAIKKGINFSKELTEAITKTLV